ncbi:hypothetical protein C2G38_2147838 [Gigaspora rosea]|uniref:F-box domain-containing protein n=1 Tax=Gigaspora rosea TaxID=44941 RepID=A0A397U9B5_9GLOM|nr:hypothetical protein C2G38_2147838 [Gigaspora rosea]
MTRETKLKKFTRQLRSGNCDIAKVTNQYLEDTVKLLCHKLRQKEISENDHSIRIKEIENLKNEINQLQIQIKNLQNELNSLKDENRKLRQENSNLHNTLIGICNNFGLIQINNGNKNSNKQIQEKNQVVINLNRRIRKILEEYKQKYERDSNIVVAGLSKITKIIEMKINEKKEWEKIEIPEILAEIGFYLDLKSLLAFSLVDKTTNRFIVSHININQTFWQTYYNCNFPSYLTKEELYFLNEIHKELQEENYFNDFEENDPIKNLFMVIHSIDCYQLVGSKDKILFSQKASANASPHFADASDPSLLPLRLKIPRPLFERSKKIKEAFLRKASASVFPKSDPRSLPEWFIVVNALLLQRAFAIAFPAE